MENDYVYEHVITLRDVTSSGIAYDGSYLEWACIARERMLVENMDVDVTDFFFPWYLVGETYIRYMSPAYIKDRIEVRINIGDYNVEKGYARLDIRFNKKDSRQLIAQGHQIIFFHDHRTGKRVEISPDFIKLIEKFKI